MTKRKNKVLQDIARVMIHMHNILMQFWVKVINITFYIASRINKEYIL